MKTLVLAPIAFCFACFVLALTAVAVVVSVTGLADG